VVISCNIAIKHSQTSIFKLFSHVFITWWKIRHRASHHLTLSVLSQFYKYHFFHLLKHWCTHMQLPLGRSKRCTRIFNYESTRWPLPSICSRSVASWTDQVSHCFRGRLQERVENIRSVNFHRFGLGDAGGPIDSRVGDLCNHVGFTDVAGTRGCAGGCLNKKSRQIRG
jgi:hypothetical protein